LEATIDRRGWSGLTKLEGGLRRLLSRHCRDENVIDDVVQETYVRAARYRGSLTKTDRLRSWVNRIALNVLADFRRRRIRYVFATAEDSEWGRLDEAPPEEPVPEYRVGRWTVAQEDAIEHLNEALKVMRPGDRAVLGAYYEGAESCHETARACGIPEHLVKIRLFRARRRLSEAIERRLSASRLRTLVEEG
jgi:RNA polymerase sigma-70 factor, ECF subfamily